MAEKDKPAATQPKNIPKDGQVVMSIMKEMGITEYEPKTIVQLTEFIYRYATSILEEARMYANNNDPKKKFLDVDDVKLALQLTTESAFTTPPPREVVLECANIKNYTPLPLVKPHCGLRLPPDRYCLSSCNYALKSCNQKKTKPSYNSPGPGGPVKVATKLNVSYVKRAPIGVTKQSITIPKAVAKVATSVPVQQKTTLKPKIQIQGHNVQLAATNGAPMEVDNPLKRKREDEGDT
ncbi:transcription initiation factor TFIID subunit 9 [Tribolium castaneum]|uniref:Transcription initiation factor TFIID subunit 9-like Protein n=1 Tax=Tribolium castaneum TaxID=7070 RepID=D7EL47_TRICA|nr:PREDICTED: transcription initiation factor TFIID subunit 9 [Tribolium castaneum]EFA11878.1 Transcription initiation factor TFIID subunit 9-like Protein [Tribolium castaneum]|eukprot:XP_969955.1 PREDICTED: transcription initiation factor TFIID subunit 9 [Tribolium castaneum]